MRTVVLVTLAGVLVSAPGCAAMSCADIGGANGVGVIIAKRLYVATGSVEIEVCDDHCATSTAKLREPPGDAPTGRGSWASFDDLGRTFEPGSVTVTVVLRDGAGVVVARRSEEIELVRDYPNGKACDGDGYVNASLRLRAADRVA